MAVISDSTFQVRLPSGNVAVYSVQPQHVNDSDRPGTTLAQRCLWHGTQIAHERAGHWFKPGGWEEITDLSTIALLERAPEAEWELEVDWEHNDTILEIHRARCSARNPVVRPDRLAYKKKGW